MQKRKLGESGLEVSAIGLGCMGMSWAYGPADDDESIAVIRRALDLGSTLLDTADVYGPFTNEEIVARAIAGRDDAVVASELSDGWPAVLEQYVPEPFRHLH